MVNPENPGVPPSIRHHCMQCRRLLEFVDQVHDCDSGTQGRPSSPPLGSQDVKEISKRASRRG